METRRRGWERLNGSIVARGSKWLLLAIKCDPGFDGHALMRVSDVCRIRQYVSSPNRTEPGQQRDEPVLLDLRFSAARPAEL